MNSLKKNIIIAVILLVGVALRLYGLGEESIWIDEGITVEVAHMHPTHLFERLSGDTHPILYFAILHYWVSLFGDSEFALRLLSVVFGSLSIIMIFLVGKELFDDKAGILSALIISLSLFHIRYAQEARPYALAVVLTLCSFYFLIRLRSRTNVWISLGYVLSSALLLYSHNLTICILVAQNIYVFTILLFWPKQIRVNFIQWVLCQIGIVIIYLPWVPVLLQQMNLVGNNFWIQEPTVGKVFRTFGSYASHSSVMLFLFFMLSIYAVLHLKPLMTKVHERNTIGSEKIFSRENGFLTTETFYLLCLWLFVPILLQFVVSIISSPVYLHRNTISASLPLYVLVGFGVRKIRPKSIQSIILILIVALSLVIVWKEYYTKQNKEDWRGIAEYVDENIKSGDLVLFYPLWTQNLTFNYYSKRNDVAKMSIKKGTVGRINGRMTRLEQVIMEYQRVWVILYKKHRNQELIDEIERNSFELSASHSRSYAHYEFRGRRIEDVQLFLYVRQPQGDSIHLSRKVIYSGNSS